MEAVGAVANIIAIVELSAKVAGLCLDYSTKVKSAKADIDRLCTELGHVQGTLRSLKDLMDGPHGSKLRATKDLDAAVETSGQRLQDLYNQLRPVKSRNPMKRFGLRALRWPFNVNQVNQVIQEFERCRSIISTALQIDHIHEVSAPWRQRIGCMVHGMLGDIQCFKQSHVRCSHHLLTSQPRNIVLNIEETAAFDRLPLAEGAAFDSHAEEEYSTCLPDTRVELLDQVTQWIDNPSSKTVFWLNGMAGTGKSTISRTVARIRDESGGIVTSFFFKRGETDRMDLKKFMPTLARQLALKIPGLIGHIKSAMDNNPNLFDKPVREQLDSLILSPLEKLAHKVEKVTPLLVVVDALDECDKDKQVQLLINLFSHIKSPGYLQFRVFITSRPELPTLHGFEDVHGTYQNLILHEIPAPLIEHDISVYLRHQLGHIKSRFNRSALRDLKLPEDWPGEGNMRALVQMVQPLFIFAATVCRLLGDRYMGSPERLLQTVLSQEQGGDHISKLHMTYSPTLNQQFAALSPYQERERRKVVESFVSVVGTIVLLSSPLSPLSLSRILDVPLDAVTHRIGLLRSVLNIPSDPHGAVRMLHLSFRDYLIDPAHRGVNEFWVDEVPVHENLGKKCLRIMRQELREDICDLRVPGTLRSSVTKAHIDQHIASELQYACLYWIHHTVLGGANTEPDMQQVDEIYTFFKAYFLHWLEIVSMIGRLTEGLFIIRKLYEWLPAKLHASFSSLLMDAERFIMSNRGIIDESPLQVYSSALIFAPHNSHTRTAFTKQTPNWISLLPTVEEEWDPCIWTLQDHTATVRAIVFSHDDKYLASASEDHTVKIWSLKTGECEQTLRGHKDSVKDVKFAPNSRLLASCSLHPSDGGQVRIWDVESGDCLHHLEYNSRFNPAISDDLQLVVIPSSDPEMVYLWDVGVGECRVLRGLDEGTQTDRAPASIENVLSKCVIRESINQQLDTALPRHTTVTTSRGARLMASAQRHTVRLWNLETGRRTHVLRGHTETVTSLIFTENLKFLLSGSVDKTVRVWCTETGDCRYIMKGHGQSIIRLAHSNEPNITASIDEDGAIRVWDLESGECRWCLESSGVQYTPARPILQFSHDSKSLLFVPNGVSVYIWTVGSDEAKKVCVHSFQVTSVAYSHDSRLVASVPIYRPIRICTTAMVGNASETTSSTHSGAPTSSIASETADLVATGFVDGKLQLWRMSTGQLEHSLQGHRRFIKGLAISADTKILASMAENEVRIWLLETAECMHVIPLESSSHHMSTMSPDSATIAICDKNKGFIYDLKTGQHMMSFDSPDIPFTSMVFSHDSTLLILVLEDGKIHIWNLATARRERILAIQSDRSDGEATYYSRTAVAFSHDSSLVACQSHDFTIKIVNVMTGTCVQTLDENEADLECLAFSSDSKLVASRSCDSIVRVWSVEDGRCRASVQYSGSHTSLSFGDYDTKLNMGSASFFLDDKAVAAVKSGCISADEEIILSERIRVDTGASTISWRGRNILYLPAVRDVGLVVVTGETVMIGCSSGEVLFFRFCAEKLDRLLV